jgi:hypothetical protein
VPILTFHPQKREKYVSINYIMAVVSKIVKHNVLHDELKIKGKSGIYCFLPYEQLDKQKKAVFKIGMTSRDFTDRIEEYHTYYPLGVYMCLFLTFQGMKPVPKKDQRKHFEKIEQDVFNAIQKHNGKRLKFPSRPGKKWDYNNAEWVYASYDQIRQAFEDVQEEYSGTLYEYNLDGINAEYRKNMRNVPKYEAKIVYFV